MKDLYSLSIKDYIDMINRYSATEDEVIALINVREYTLSASSFAIQNINTDIQTRVLQKYIELGNWAYEESFKLRIAALETGVLNEEILRII